ncbi:hypothetical protein RhiirA5_436856 [Rhizophagus irregularis]|uniref:Uncharacterized protein n=1 Tax=Rhizophagus irregularis TaxID=588596 RepID=A0A2N0NLD1_9GLOM|nr:hypothetical protein RhiirA5_436856 [Rhizophagus irregularis]
MTSKSKESYERLFQKLVDFSKENNQILSPPLIISDFEQPAINAAQIPNAFDQVKSLMPPNLVQYFEDNYVYGKVIRCHQHRHNQSVIQKPPQFSPVLWSVYELVESGHSRTQNTVEG